jgi:hypothetical protein
MRIKVLAFAASLLLISNSSAGIPQGPMPTSSQQAATLLAQSAKVLTGSTTINDVTLTGSVEWKAGSDDETGTATYKALPNANRLDMSFSSGTRSEVRNGNDSSPVGAWTGIDGVSHGMAHHNLLTDPGWFPLFALSNINASSNSLVTYVGLETRSGASVIHLAAMQQFSSSVDSNATLLQHLSQVDIYLDPTTFLPVSFVFSAHPDVNALLDIPTEIHFSNYQSFGGTQIPLHVQKFVNDSLTVDLQFEHAVLNSGLSASMFAIQ